MGSVGQLRKAIYGTYAEAIGLDPDAYYIHGTPLRPVVPLDAARGGVFIIGAYPSARFWQIDGIRDVPVADNLGPFESERWFDGTRVREQPSAHELDTLYLQPLALHRRDCWTTNLVKVFLFKQEHRTKYAELGSSVPVGYSRQRFHELGKRSVPFLEQELRLAKPRFVVTLGREVAGVLNGVRSPPRQSALLVPTVSEIQIGEVTLPGMHCAHPGILMRNPTWRERHELKFIPALLQALPRRDG